MADLPFAAHSYAERGWPVLPVEPRGKRPLSRLVRHGLCNATTDHDTIDDWWAAEPEANVGVATGFAFDAIDIDGPEGHVALVCEMPEGTPTPEMPMGVPTIVGPTADTGRGWHCYVAVTGRGNRAGVVPHVDWRGRGGYVVSPPSVHPSGDVYRWHCGPHDPDFGAEAAIRPAPAWVLELLDRRPGEMRPWPGPLTRAERTSAYAKAAIESEVGRVTLAPVGQRNETLNRAAFSLGQLVAGGKADFDDVANALLRAAELIALPATEARRTIASGLTAAADRPRHGVAT